MGRKSSGKTDKTAPSASTAPKGSSKAIVVGVLLVAVIGAGFAFWRLNEAAQPVEAQAARQAPAAPAVATVPEVNRKPHPQKNLPPLQFPAYQMPRPPQVVRAAYQFAAEHPEVLSYMPCFCGCERAGHRGNEDCFVKARDVKGDVIEWDEHGMECAICLDVATRASTLYAEGAKVPAIRDAIEKQFAGRATNHTPTPHPPHQ